MRTPPPLLAVENLTVSLASSGRWVPVVRELSFTLQSGELVGLVGESGAGKSLTALAIMRLLPPAARITGGRVLLGGEDLALRTIHGLREVRGARVAMVFQEPAAALNPAFTIGFQISEAIRAHRRVTRTSARRETEELLELVAMPEPRLRRRLYPHQLSGGQLQRAMLAMALAGRPELLLADEPTSAVDVTIQAQVLDLLQRLRSHLGLTILLITHDLPVVAETCERVLVMYAGEIVEEAATGPLFRHPRHPYTAAVLAALQQTDADSASANLSSIAGQSPLPGELPAGCAFQPRCPQALQHCGVQRPDLVEIGTGHVARCLLYGDGTPV